MSEKGGYQILNLRNIPFRYDEGVVVPGIYDTINNTRKALLISGIEVMGSVVHNWFAFAVPISNGSYIIAMPYGTTTVQIDPDDLVTVSQ